MVENDLIEKCRNGNLAAFRELVNKTSPMAFSVAFRMTGDEAVSSDIVQEAMVTVWKKIHDVRSDGSFRSWMYRIVINKCYDELRGRKRNPEIRADEKTWALLSDRMGAESPAHFENHEIAQVIGQLTRHLSPKQKAVFILADLEDMTLEEVANATGISRMSVKANLHYARQKMSEMLEKYL